MPSLKETSDVYNPKHWTPQELAIMEKQRDERKTLFWHNKNAQEIWNIIYSVCLFYGFNRFDPYADLTGSSEYRISMISELNWDKPYQQPTGYHDRIKTQYLKSIGCVKTKEDIRELKKLKAKLGLTEIKFSPFGQL